MKLVISAISFALLTGTAFAQQPMPGPQQQPNPTESKLSTEWSSMQLAQQHFVDALTKLVEEARATKMTLDAERKYWAEYVAGLTPKPTASKP